MLSYNEIKPKRYIVLNGEPYEVLSSNVFRKQKRKPVNQTKLKHLKTGKVVEHSFHQSDTVEEADIETKKIRYLFNKSSHKQDGKEFWFCDQDNPKDRFFLSEKIIKGNPSLLKENTNVDALVFRDIIIGISLPIKITLNVVESPPAVKGNTAQGGTKQVKLETGATLTVPLFIQEGDNVVVNTETGDYVERAKE